MGSQQSAEKELESVKKNKPTNADASKEVKPVNTDAPKEVKPGETCQLFMKSKKIEGDILFKNEFDKSVLTPKFIKSLGKGSDTIVFMIPKGCNVEFEMLQSEKASDKELEVVNKANSKMGFKYNSMAKIKGGAKMSVTSDAEGNKFATMPLSVREFGHLRAIKLTGTPAKGADIPKHKHVLSEYVKTLG